MLRLEMINKVADVKGTVVEVLSWPNGEPAGYHWDNGRDFANGGAPVAFDFRKSSSELPWKDKIHAVIWFFGPSKVKSPQSVLAWLHARMSDDGMIHLTNEIPWHGKTSQTQEFALYNNEEIHALLVRNGFNCIEHLEEGLYFRHWRARKSTNVVPERFMKVETELTNGDWQAAVAALGKLDDQLDSLPAVREYALLLAACHDLAGNTARSYAALTEALRLDPRCGRALCGLGRLAALNDDLDGALLFFDSALRKSPYLVAALEGRATVNEMLGNYRSAYEDLLDATSFRPGDRELLLDVIRVGNQLGLHEEVTSLLFTRADTGTDWDSFQLTPEHTADDPRIEHVIG